MSRFTPQFLDELRARTTLSTLIGQATKLQRAGREWRACCPFHDEKTPSFYVNDDKGFYHCFGCSAHGDAIRWLTDQRGLAFVDAVKELADSAGLALPAPDPQAAERASRASSLYDVMAAASAWFVEQLHGDGGAEARAYLKKRGVSSETARAFGIGFAPDRRDALKAALTHFGEAMLVEAGLLIQVDDKAPYDRFRGRLMIPIRDPRGRVIAFGGRILGEGEPKYLNSPDTPLFDKGRTLYNLDRAAPAARKATRLIVVEGYLDVIALAQVGIDEVVAPLGTALTEAQLDRLWRVVDVPVLCFDGDGAGRKAAVRAAERALPMLAPGRSLSIALLPNGQDPDDLVRGGGREGVEAVISASYSLHDFIWRHFLSESDLTTPEQRSKFGKTLRDIAATIRDESVRVFYLAAFNEFLSAMFEQPRKPQDGDRFERFKRTRRLRSPESLAIAKYGIDKAVHAPAVVKGLIRYPAMIAAHAEVLAHFWVLLRDREYRLICEELLRVALTVHPLEAGELRAILIREGHEKALDVVLRRKALHFSFGMANADEQRAQKDLSAVLDLLAATPEIREALEASTVRLQVGGADAGSEFLEQQRLRKSLRRLEMELADIEKDVLLEESWNG